MKYAAVQIDAHNIFLVVFGFQQWQQVFTARLPRRRIKHYRAGVGIGFQLLYEGVRLIPCM